MKFLFFTLNHGVPKRTAEHSNKPLLSSISSAPLGAWTWLILWNEKSPRACGVLVTGIATSQVILFVSIADLWLRNLILKSVGVDPTYCKRHFLQEASKSHFLNHTKVWNEWCNIGWPRWKDTPWNEVVDVIFFESPDVFPKFGRVSMS